jgi:hypothetical protein
MVTGVALRCYFWQTTKLQGKTQGRPNWGAETEDIYQSTALEKMLDQSAVTGYSQSV